MCERSTQAANPDLTQMAAVCFPPRKIDGIRRTLGCYSGRGVDGAGPVNLDGVKSLQLAGDPRQGAFGTLLVVLRGPSTGDRSARPGCVRGSVRTDCVLLTAPSWPPP